jgi:L-2-hydroxyglutarate oxidase LhgO
MPEKCDVLVIGSGVVGLAVGIALLSESSALKVIVAEKEIAVASHASGRNSGVLHSGFYYSTNSLKARFCLHGNFELRALAKKYDIQVKNTGKVVVTRNFEEIIALEKLFNLGIANGVQLELLESNDLPKFEPLARTFGKFLWSPHTGVSSPKLITEAMAKEFVSLGGRIDFGSKINLGIQGDSVVDKGRKYDAKYIVNTAGAQADRISRSVNVGLDYAMLPFAGFYRYVDSWKLPLRTLVYPVPNPISPFLGVHFTVTTENKVKIGPTAIPIIGREQYTLMSSWSIRDLQQSFVGATSLLKADFAGFRNLVTSEIPKIQASRLINDASELIPQTSKVSGWKKLPPGIRAQLVHLPTGKLEQDFVIRNWSNSTHVLNAVSPGWTSSLPFGRYIAKFALDAIK